MSRRLVVALACRNKGSRLYGKPLQNLDVGGSITVLDNILDCLETLPCIDEVVLGIATGVENEVYRSVAESKGLQYVIGDEADVLSRLIACGERGNATDVLRVTSESPFLYFEPVVQEWERYVREGADALFFDDVIDGCGFEIVSLDVLKISHANGSGKHFEHCTLYIREHNTDFKIIRPTPPRDLVRRDLRLTVDNPEDLAVCRTIYGVFKAQAPRIPVCEIVRFLDANPKLIELTAPFAEQGYQTMYVWGKS